MYAELAIRVALILSDQHRKSYGYLWATFDCFWWETLLTVIPRTALLALGFAQVYFMNSAINYLDLSSEERDVRKAYGLLGAAALIYPTIAVRHIIIQNTGLIAEDL